MKREAPMELSSNSKIVQWAFLLDDAKSNVSLCELFWRCVLISPIQAVMIGTLMTILSPIWVPMVAFKKYTGKEFDVWFRERQDARDRRKLERMFEAREAVVAEPSTWVLFVAWLAAVKGRVCPLIRIRSGSALTVAAVDPVGRGSSE